MSVRGDLVDRQRDLLRSPGLGEDEAMAGFPQFREGKMPTRAMQKLMVRNGCMFRWA
jgi:hypothetical protein